MQLRKKMLPAVTQRALAERLQLMGYDFDRLTIQRIEAGKRFVADYEVQALAKALFVEVAELFTTAEEDKELDEREQDL